METCRLLKLKVATTDQRNHSIQIQFGELVIYRNMGENRSAGDPSSPITLKSTLRHGLWFRNNASQFTVQFAGSSSQDSLLLPPRFAAYVTIGKSSGVFNALSFVSFLSLKSHPFPSGRECFHLKDMMTSHITFWLLYFLCHFFMLPSLVLKASIQRIIIFFYLWLDIKPPHHSIITHSQQLLVMSHCNNHNLLQIRIFSP